MISFYFTQTRSIILVNFLDWKLCSRTFTNNYGAIMSPYYPLSYSLNVYCNWTIALKSTYDKISLKLVRRSFQSNTSCSYNSMKVGKNQYFCKIFMSMYTVLPQSVRCLCTHALISRLDMCLCL